MTKSLFDYCKEHDTFIFIDQWNKEKNGSLTVHDISYGSHKKVWWKCSKGHEWEAQVKSRIRGTGCPVCSNRKVLSGENDLVTTHPELASEWHPTKNGDITPQSVVSGHHGKVWWLCKKGHVWQATVLSRTKIGNGCPICAGKVVIPGVNDLASANPGIAVQWNQAKNGSLTPQQVTPFSNRKVWWICEKGHEYNAVIANRIRNASGCPYCRNKKVLAGFNDLATVAPKVAAQWCDELNGDLTPQMVTAGSHKKVWWKCSCGHVWKAVIYARTGNQKTECPICAGRVKNSSLKRYDGILASGKNNDF